MQGSERGMIRGGKGKMWMMSTRSDRQSQCTKYQLAVLCGVQLENILAALCTMGVKETIKRFE